MLKSGQITSVQLTRAYLARITAINKAGPGLNAVTQINPEALKQAAQSDYDRAHGKDYGPAMGLPILLKDIIDATPMYTSAATGPCATPIRPTTPASPSSSRRTAWSSSASSACPSGPTASAASPRASAT